MQVRSLLLVGLVLVVALATSGPAMADSTGYFDITASGAGSYQPTVQEVGVQLTGSFQFNPGTLVVSDAVFDASLTSVGAAGTSLSESWTFGPLTATAGGPNGWDLVNFAGYVGSLGDVLQFSAYLYPDGSGGFVPSIGESGIAGETPGTVQFNYLDGWAGQISDPAPVPEPGTWLLLAAGLLVLTVKAARR